MDELAEASPELDRFCSSSAWALSAAEAFSPEAAPLIVDAADGMVALLRHPGGPPDVVTPFEAMWGLGSPFLGPRPDALVDALWGALPRARAVFAFLGVKSGGAAARAVATRFAPRFG